ncbi:MAG: tetratricopeptide repeat protein [Phycisphaerales bacterium]|nr:tetratricopeptide repeat protein [Phycisphaerales bacterium]
MPGPSDRLGILACVFVGVLVVALSWFKLSSLDIGYHVAYGRHFLKTGEIVGDRPDPFIYPENGTSFVNANWGSQVIMALVERLAGAGGLISLRITLTAIIFACLAIIVRQHVSSWLAVAMAWMLAAVAAYERFSMRPELFSYAVMSLQFVLLMRGIRSWRSITALAVLQLAWVNLHSYFLVGLVLSGAWLLGSAFSARKGSGDQGAAEARKRVRFLAVALLIQIVACAVNPRHVHGAVFPLRTLEFLQTHEAMGGAMGDPSESAWSEISEFQSPFSFHGEKISGRTIHAYYVLLGIGSMGVLALLVRGRVAAVLVIVILFLMTTQMRRNIAQFALLAAPLSVAGISMLIPWSRIQASVLRILKFATVLIISTLSCWWSVQIVDGRFYYGERRIIREFGSGYSDYTFPRRAVQWLADCKDLQPKLFIDYFSSSNALQWLPERFKLFVDTNTFAYEDETLGAAFDLVTGKISHQAFFNKHGVNVVMLRCSSNTQMLVRAMMLNRGDWALVYYDPDVVVFVRRIVPHVNAILANDISEMDLSPEQWIKGFDGPPHRKAVRLYTAANVPMFLGWFRSAAALLEEAVRLAPDHQESWINLGLCHGNLLNAAMRTGDLEEGVRRQKFAVECFEKALELDPANEIARANLKRAQSSFARGQ